MSVIDNFKRLLPRENVGQCADHGWFDDLYQVPRLVQHVAIEKLDTAAIQFDGAPRMRFHKRRKEILDFVWLQVIRTAIEKIGNPPNCS